MADRRVERPIFQLLESTGLAYGNLTLIGYGPVVAGQADNDRNLLESSFKCGRNTSTKTESGPKYN